MKSLRIAVLITSFFLCSYIHAQPLKKFTAQTFTVNEGLLVNRIVDIAEDNSGFMFISSGAGLQRFNGSSFETIEPQPGLPETNHPHFFKLKDGTIWLSYYHGISSYSSITNKFKVVLKNPVNINKTNAPAQYEISPVMPEVECGKLVWCWCVFNNKFIAINKFNYKIEDSLNVPGNSKHAIQNFQAAGNGNLFFMMDESFGQVNFQTKKIYFFKDEKNKAYNYLVFKNEIIALTKNAFYKINIVTGFLKILSNYPQGITIDYSSSATFNNLNNDFLSLSVKNKLYIIDGNSGKFLYQIVNTETKPIIELGYNNFCRMDSYRHLWIVSLVHGLVKINFNNAGIKYYGATNMQKNFTRCIYADKKSDLILAGNLYNGISVFDTSSNLIKQFNLQPATPSTEVSSILKIAPYKYLLFLPSTYSVVLLNTQSWKITPVSKIPFVDYYTITQLLNDSTALLICSHQAIKLHFKNDSIRLEQILTDKFSLCGLLNKNNQLWLGATGKYSILSGKNFEHESVFPLQSNVVTKCLFEDKLGNMWMGTESGLYKLNSNTGAILHVYKKADGLADENIYSILNDDNNNIWFSTNKGISCLKKDGAVINLFASDGLQASEFNGNSAAKADDGELFFGGINGFNSFYPTILKNIASNPGVVMNSIKVMDEDLNNDTAAWNTHRLKLSYKKNILSFSFTALGRYNPNVYNYQYKMNGIDKSWVNAGNTGFARYVLSPGNYTFEYAASNRFEKNIKQVKHISIIITPPFWKTIWFDIVLSICVILILIFIIRFYLNQEFKQQLRHTEIHHRIEQERQRISRDLHDNIGAYTTVLIANTEKLNSQISQQDAKQSAINVSENAKDIMNALHETIWVLNNDTISITNFIDRFKLYTKKILQNFTDVHIQYKEQIEKDITLSPAESLHLSRIMQEAVQNALKHAAPKNIIISIFSKQNLFISVKDDGKGFDTLDASAGNGLPNMEHRAKEAGYEFRIFSSPQGTETILQKNTSFAV